MPSGYQVVPSAAEQATVNEWAVIDCGIVTLSYKRRHRITSVFALVTVLAIVALVVAYLCADDADARQRKPKNVILMISDGFGPASQTMARNYNAHVNNLPFNTKLPLDDILVGSSRTRSADSLVTDSAAGATAFACALKTYNGAIAVDANKAPCGTVLEAAKALGMKTGLVATSRITHATPGSFSSHVVDRNMENEIALQQLGNYSLGRNVDLMFGGGACHFRRSGLPGSCRSDNVDPADYAASVGWNSIWTRREFDDLDKHASLPLLGLFTSDHMSYEIDRQPEEEPSLTEMALKALKILKSTTEKTEKGFFLMIEGSRIDMAGHSNDAAAHVHEILQYNAAIAAVKAWVEDDGETVMISVSDHETGGLSVAHQLGTSYPTYKWSPDAVKSVQNSTYILGVAIAQYSGSDFGSFIKESVLHSWLGITDAMESEVQFLSTAGKPASAYDAFIAQMISDRAELGWATHGHSAVDVNLYSYGINSDELRGNHENIDVGTFIVKQLGLDLQAITAKLGSVATVTSSSNGVPQEKQFKEVHYHHDQP